MSEAIIGGLIEPLPWHQQQWKDIQDRIKSDVLPHALLLSGLEGMGKTHFAHYLALSLLCHDRDTHGAPCGHCRGCNLNRAGNHPDLIYLRVLPEKKEIAIDQVRELKELLTLKAQYGGYKIIIISPADALNRNSANSLLKTLEEPPPGNLFLLCSHQPADLPATIRSRCQTLKFQRPEMSVAKKWLIEQSLGDSVKDIVDPNMTPPIDLLLNMADGAPLMAVKIAQDGLGEARIAHLQGLEQLVSGQANPSKVAEEWLKLGAKESLYWLHSWIIDMIRLAMSAEPALLANPELRKPLQKLAHLFESRHLFQHLDKTGEAMKQLNQPLNQQLMLEDLLMSWSKNIK